MISRSLALRTIYWPHDTARLVKNITFQYSILERAKTISKHSFFRNSDIDYKEGIGHTNGQTDKRTRCNA